MSQWWERKTGFIAAFSLVAILLHLLLRFAFHTSEEIARLPLLATLFIGGAPLVYDLLKKLWRREFGSDLLAGISITTAIFLGEYLAGSIVVLMLSGGEALENYAMHNASSVLRALARRMPSVAHRKRNGQMEDIAIEEIAIGDIIVVFPHDICPVDGIVTEGHGVMDESFLTGEPFQIEKAPGSEVISGAVNGNVALTMRATKLPIDSRYSKIMEVMRASEQNRPKLRRLGDQLGAFYTPLAVAIALLAWIASGEAIRFLAVLVVATPCPLLIGIPVAIIGSISLSARRGIIVKNPVALEQIEKCRTAIFDKTGTLTYGEPKLTEQLIAPFFKKEEVLRLAASLERYSKHPLAKAILAAAREHNIPPEEAAHVSEPPGCGLRGTVGGREVEITNRRKMKVMEIVGNQHVPEPISGLECIVLVDGTYAATYRFHDAPRTEGRSFILHLAPKHHFKKLMILSGDRESEVRYLAAEVGIDEIHAQKTPEEKLAIVREETLRAKTVYVGDGINDAPAMMAATVGIGIGQNSDVTAEAADVVIMEGELKKVDEFMHISRRMRSIALQSAVGGMALSVGGMVLAAFGYLPPVAGAVTQEIIDVLAVLNALRAAWPPKEITDFD
ncbi:MAG: cadmium-translocating P-type ATPase [Verrucomicrobia bacterium]|nr:cadmium-translocating P-type ATPase [Verrucomicrobiota bacterium]